MFAGKQSAAPVASAASRRVARRGAEPVESLPRSDLSVRAFAIETFTGSAVSVRAAEERKRAFRFFKREPATTPRH